MKSLKLERVNHRLQEKNIDLTTTEGCNVIWTALGAILPITEWHYDFVNDTLMLAFSDVGDIPSEILEFGEVLEDGSTEN